MKKFLLTALAFSLLLTSFATPKKYKLLSSTADWSNATNWAPTGVPKDGDTVLIPENTQLTISQDVSLSDVYFDVYGSLILSGNSMKLYLLKSSTLNIHTGGWIDGTKASQQIVLSNIIFKGDQPVVTGPKIATSISSALVPYTEFTILPVTFLSFNITQGSNNAFLVKWTTANETGAARYDVQRSTDGNAWTTLASLAATGNTTNSYSYTDQTIAATVYYRIKQIDADGTFTYTAVRVLKNTGTNAVSIWSVRQKVMVQFAQTVKGLVTIEIIGMNGMIAATQTIAAPSGTVELTTPALKGIYVVRVSNGQALNTAKQVLL